MTTTPLLMIPGPTPVAPAVLAALAEPVRSHSGPENAATMLRIQEGIRRLVGSEGARIHCFAGAGTLAMEAAMVNHAAPGDRVVVISHGYFGDRYTEIAGALGMRTDVLAVEWGQRADQEVLRALIRNGDPPALVCFTHVDTSSGVLADCAETAATIRAAAPDTVIVLDGVCATGGIEESMDAWDVDVLLTGARRRSACRRASPCSRSRSELAGGASRSATFTRTTPTSAAGTRPSTIRASTSPLMRCRCFARSRSPSTPSSPRGSRRVAAMIRDGMGELGLEPLTNPACLAPTLSVLALPDGVDDATLRAGMNERGVVIAGCLGPWAGRGVRIGHMGTVTETEAARTIDAAAATLGAHA
jgi:aspartate aminotransferase-like enzyme